MHHEVLADRIVPRINDLFQKGNCGGVKHFSRWKHPLFVLPKQINDGDSGFLATKFLVLWNGDALQTTVIRRRATIYRGERCCSSCYTTVSMSKRSFLVAWRHIGLDLDGVCESNRSIMLILDLNKHFPSLHNATFASSCEQYN
uniref:Uncharacterized protein n=1 Tax=Arundo donax TaxID=35708 RepID=A0A0A9D2N2_ARUDO